MSTIKKGGELMRDPDEEDEVDIVTDGDDSGVW
jgi:hypothetical protein